MSFFLVFETWSILYSTVVNSELGIFANQIQTQTSEVGDSIQKHLGPGGGSSLKCFCIRIKIVQVWFQFKLFMIRFLSIYIHTEKYFRNFVDSKPNLDCNYLFPIDLTPNGVRFGS